MKKILIPLQKFTHVLPALIFPLAMAGWQAAHADAVVSWGGNMVSANTNLVLPSSTDNGSIRTWKWNTGSPNISPNSGYTGQPFYGALQIDGATSFGRLRMTDNGTADYLDLLASGVDATVSGLIFFKPDVMIGDTVSFDTNSSLSADIKYLNYSPRSVRFAVLNDGTWYLSSNQVGGATTFSLADPDTASWGAWNVTDAAPFPAIPGSFPTLGSTFTDIQGIGIYFTAKGNGDSSGGRFELSSFTANALVVPEPSTALLLLLGGGLVMMSRRCRRHGVVS